MTAKAKAGKKLDPVGQEDKDIDNDGDHDKTDKYLLKRRKAIGAAIRKKADKKIKEAYLADGTISTEPKPGTQKITGKDPVTGGPVDNYATGAVTVNPDDGLKPTKKVGVYAHLELKGSSLSEAQKKMIEMYDSKKKEMKKKDKISDMMTKDSVKKDDEKKEEEPDMRGKYAMINIIKNKLRAAGQRDPMVMAVDACEENLLEKGMGTNERELAKKRMQGDIEKNQKKVVAGEQEFKIKEMKREHYDWRSTLDEKCWDGYEKKGMKTMFGKRYPNCVKKSKKKK